MDLVRGLGRRLPKPIKNMAAQILSRSIVDKEIIKDLIKFYNARLDYKERPISYSEALSICKIAWRLDADLWTMLKPKTKKEITNYYKLIPYYPFELAYWHMRFDQRSLRKKIVAQSFGEVLDYGGGIGDLCIKLAEKGLKVTYGDIKDGMNWEFATYLFKKREHNINIINLAAGKIPENLIFDTIICIDTIEHVLRPDIVLRDIASRLRKKGKLIITALNCSGKNEDNPMHMEIQFNAEKLLNSLGLFKAGYDWLWIKT